MKANKIYLERLRKNDFVDRPHIQRTLLTFTPKNTRLNPTKIIKLFRYQYEIIEDGGKMTVIDKKPFSVHD